MCTGVLGSVTFCFSLSLAWTRTRRWRRRCAREQKFWLCSRRCSCRVLDVWKGGKARMKKKNRFSLKNYETLCWVLSLHRANTAHKPAHQCRRPKRNRKKPSSSSSYICCIHTFISCSARLNRCANLAIYKPVELHLRLCPVLTCVWPHDGFACAIVQLFCEETTTKLRARCDERERIASHKKSLSIT